MIHPFLEDLTKLKDNEIQAKITKLLKYHGSTTNPQIRSQILMILDEYNAEGNRRREEQYKKIIESSDSKLGHLINVKK